MTHKTKQQVAQDRIATITEIYHLIENWKPFAMKPLSEICVKNKVDRVIPYELKRHGYFYKSPSGQFVINKTKFTNFPQVAQVISQAISQHQIKLKEQKKLKPMPTPTRSIYKSKVKWNNAISAIYERLCHNPTSTQQDLQKICTMHNITRVLPALLLQCDFIMKNEMGLYVINPKTWKSIQHVEFTCRTFNRKNQREYLKEKRQKIEAEVKPITFPAHTEVNDLDVLTKIVKLIDTKHLISELQQRGFHIFSSVKL